MRTIYIAGKEARGVARTVTPSNFCIADLCAEMASWLEWNTTTNELSIFGYFTLPKTLADATASQMATPLISGKIVFG